MDPRELNGALLSLALSDGSLATMLSVFWWLLSVIDLACSELVSPPLSPSSESIAFLSDPSGASESS